MRECVMRRVIVRSIHEAKGDRGTECGLETKLGEKIVVDHWLCVVN